ncbi:Protein of unknown function [Gryllus bimaculatus]|nr:Protein of unknown function [Gryllus bimaculatus]
MDNVENHVDATAAASEIQLHLLNTSCKTIKDGDSLVTETETPSGSKVTRTYTFSEDGVLLARCLSLQLPWSMRKVVKLQKGISRECDLKIFIQ